VFPLWLCAAPHALQQLFEWIAVNDELRRTALKAHFIVTMDMPALVYRPRNSGNEKRSAPHNPFTLKGVHAGETTLIGSVTSISKTERARWIADMREIASRHAEHENSTQRSIFGLHFPSFLARRAQAAPDRSPSFQF